MFRRNLWKITFSLLLVAWAVSTLLPLHDTPFADYARAHVTAKAPEFKSLLDEAAARTKTGTAPSDFVALKRIAKERSIDLSSYFPDYRLEASLKNLDRRNEIVLNELLRRTKGSSLDEAMLAIGFPSSGNGRLQAGLDLKGGVAVTLEVDPKAAEKYQGDERKEKLTKAIEIIEKRINRYGVAEPLIRPVGTNRIEIQLAGVNIKDNPDIVDVLKAPAQLSFRLVYPNAVPGPGVDTPPGYEIMTERDDEGRNGGQPPELFIRRIPEMTGEIISEARAVNDPMTGRPKVTMQFTAEGRKRFAAVTKEIAALGASGRPGQMAIVLDGQLYSAPTVQQEIDSPSAEITGRFTDRQVLDLANVLNNPLDLPLVVKEQYEVGPTLAQDAVDSGMKAAVIGTVLVAAFMITFYTTGGLVSVITLAVNLLVILAVMASFGATMTLPGLAGIVLTVGMAVDANILIFERMREELALGKSLLNANQVGYSKALWTILDAHAVQLIICAIMIWLGTGPIKGFGITLAIGVLSTLFSVLITAHLVLELLIESNTLKKITMRHLLKSIHVDFIKYGKAAFIGSFTLVAIGIAVVLFKGDKIYGIDFAGGDAVSVRFTQTPDEAKIRSVATASGVNGISITTVKSLAEGKQTLNIETPEGKSGVVFEALQKAFPNSGIEQVGQNHIGASVGSEIKQNALLAVGVSMLTILFYIAFRFEFGFGVGAMFSTFHDILMTIGIFVLTGRQFNAPMVAAILCIAGYSINETVVVFDRIREELKLNPTGSLRDIINSAINKVFARTIMTSTTTFLAAMSLFVFGSGQLSDIAFTFLVGIVTSTFSAIFIASQVFYWWHKGDRKHVEAHADVAPKYEWTGSSKASH